MPDPFASPAVPGPGDGAPAELIRMASAYWLSRAVSAAADLGLADALAGGPLAVEDLAARVGAEPRALARLTRVLSGAGLLRQEPDGRVSLTPAGSPLRGDHPQSVRAMVRMLGAESYRAWAELTETVRTGRPGFEIAFGTSFYDHLARDEDARALFDEAMRERHPALQPGLALALGLSGDERLLDVGAGAGELAARVLSLHPRLRATLVDTPETLAAARDRLAAEGVLERATLHATRDLAELPGDADHVVIASLLHNLDDQAAVRVLEGCRRAVTPRGRLSVAEIVIPPGPGPSYAALLDLEIMVLFRGRERTLEEHEVLLREAGWLVEGAHPLDSRMTLIRAVPAP